jgi:hypothetical protein
MHDQMTQSPRRGAWATFSDEVSRRLWFLDSEGLCAEARRRTRLEDFGVPPIQPAFSFLAETLEKEASLSPLGRYLMRVHLRDLLETRLLLTEEWRRQEAAMSATPIRRPVFITGIPRSGSTFLHELLSEDPGNRSPRVWEVMFPHPAPRPQTWANDPRIRKAEVCLWWFRRLVPRADEVYPMRARTPHECVAIHSYTMMSEEFTASCRLPSYRAYLRRMDRRLVYEWQRKFLQYLQIPDPNRRWILKAPDHVHALDAVFSVFPDAMVIHTHRTPLAVLKSSCHLSESLHGLYGRPIPRNQVGALELQDLADNANHGLEFREAHPELADRFIDVTYAEFTADPLATVRRIYQRLDIPLTEIAAGRMSRMIASRTRYPNRGTVPSLAEFGINAEAEVPRFERYCTRFGVPLRPK